MTLKNRLILKLILFLLFVFFVYAIYKVTALQTKPRPLNLILISVDTLRPDHMGIYGYKKNTTPNIDAWAKNAFVFTNANTVVPSTYPSLAALMTGLHPFTTRIFENGLSPAIDNNVMTLPKILKENNFETAAFVTNPVLEPSLTNLNAGFDQFNQFDAFGSWKEDRKKYQDFIDKGPLWIESHKNNRFFLWIHLMDPHYPYFPPRELAADTKSIEQLGKIASDMYGCRKNPSLPSQINFFKNLYDGDIAAADLLVKKILDKINENGLDKNSIVIFYGDHGEGFDHNYYLVHGNVLYRSTARTPLIVKLPIFSQGKQIDRLVDNTDIMPTTLDLLGISKKNFKFAGKSFAHIFYDSFITKLIPLGRRDFVYSLSMDLKKYSIYDGRYTFIYSLPGGCLYEGKKEEFYDTRNDPGELNDIRGIKTEQAKRLKTQLLDTISKYNFQQEKTKEAVPRNSDILNKLKSLGY